MTIEHPGMDELVDAVHSDAASAVFAAVDRANAAVAGFQRRLAERLDLTPSECTAVQFVHQREAEGTATRANDIRMRLGVTSAATTQILDHLVRRGRVSRAVDHTDRRHRVVTLTPATHGELVAIVDPPNTEIDAVADGISARDSRRIVDLLGQVTRILDDGVAPRRD